MKRCQFNVLLELTTQMLLLWCIGLKVVLSLCIVSVTVMPSVDPSSRPCKTAFIVNV